MAEDSSLDSSFPVVHKGNGNLVLRTVEDGEKEQPDSSSSSSNLLDSKCCQLVDWNSHAAVKRDAKMYLTKQSGE